jgi:hypothetical protein
MKLFFILTLKLNSLIYPGLQAYHEWFQELLLVPWLVL